MHRRGGRGQSEETACAVRVAEMGPIGGCICDQLRRALGKGAPDKTLRHRHLETGDVDRPLADNTFKDTFIGTMQEQRARLRIESRKNPWQRPSQPVDGVAARGEALHHAIDQRDVVG